MASQHPPTEEEKRLAEVRENKAPWRRFGPYVSERQWGTVREDYSPDGDAWKSFGHEQARSRAYRWGEDGIAGISDDQQHLCFALALWNGADAILKERMFGLTGPEGNHGEDVKEYYFYLDNLPSHAYMKYLYKYPQQAYPYQRLLDENRRRDRHEPEFELLDTGIFDEDRYFDVFVEYAKEGPNDVLVRISAFNRGPEPAELTLLPTLWFRNEWSWSGKQPRPQLARASMRSHAIAATHVAMEPFWLYHEPPDDLLFTENETN
ncbi:MAG TPA: glucosidase, partial [Variovorax sp.]